MLKYVLLLALLLLSAFSGMVRASDPVPGYYVSGTQEQNSFDLYACGGSSSCRNACLNKTGTTRESAALACIAVLPQSFVNGGGQTMTSPYGTPYDVYYKRTGLSDIRYVTLSFTQTLVCADGSLPVNGQCVDPDPCADKSGQTQPAMVKFDDLNSGVSSYDLGGCQAVPDTSQSSCYVDGAGVVWCSATMLYTGAPTPVGEASGQTAGLPDGGVPQVSDTREHNQTTTNGPVINTTGPDGQPATQQTTTTTETSTPGTIVENKPATGETKVQEFGDGTVGTKTEEVTQWTNPDGSQTTQTTKSYNKDLPPSTVTIINHNNGTTTTYNTSGGTYSGSTTQSTTTNPDGSSTTTTTQTGGGGMDGKPGAEGAEEAAEDEEDKSDEAVMPGHGGYSFNSAGADDFYPDGAGEGLYPNGFKGVWDEKKAALMQTAFMQSIEDSFALGSVGGGQCPSWSFSFNLGNHMNYQNAQLEVPCWIWDAIGAIVVLTAAFAARQIIFGG